MNNKNTKELPVASIPGDIEYYHYGLDDKTIPSLRTIFNPNLLYFSHYIDISILEAITFTGEDYYEAAINSIDRGFPIIDRITPSKNGAAMTLTLKRDSGIKCHILFNVNHWTKNTDNSLTNHTLSIIAHEMAHVEITKNLYNYKKDICFPKLFNSFKAGKGFEISKKAIEEFGACKKSYENYGQLFILSSYYLGSKENSIEYHADIQNHKLFKYIKELLILLNEAYKNYPSWQDSGFYDI